MAYQDNYKQAAEAYKENGGPSDDLCQYYEGTHVPMFTQPGVGPFRGGMSGFANAAVILIAVMNK